VLSIAKIKEERCNVNSGCGYVFLHGTKPNVTFAHLTASCIPEVHRFPEYTMQ
jgi:hypothetical protein